MTGFDAVVRNRRMTRAFESTPLARETLLADLPVYPKRLSENGYQFRFPDLHSALCHLLGREA